MMYPELDYFMNDDKSDVVFVICGQRVPAIKHVLSIKSDVFRAMFSGNWKESNDREVRIEDTTFETFQSMIKFLYTGQVIPVDDQKIDFIRDMIILAERYQLKRLVEEMCDHIKESLSLDNFDDFCKLVYDLDAKALIPILKSYMKNNFYAFQRMDLKRLKTIDRFTDQSWLEIVMVEQFKTSVTELNESELKDFSEYPEFEYFMNENLSDVVFIVGEHKVPASKQLFALKSTQFRNLFETNKDVKEITLEGTSFQAFKELVYFIYTDNIHVDKKSNINNFPSLYELACKYKIYRCVHQHVESMEITANTFELIAETAYNMSHEYKSVLLLKKLEQFMDNNFKQHFYRRSIGDLKRINTWTEQSLFEIIYSRLKKAQSLFRQHSFHRCTHYCQKIKHSRFSTVLEKLNPDAFTKEQNEITFENFDEKCQLVYETKSESEIRNVKLFIENNFEKFFDKDIGNLKKINELTDQSLFEIWIQRLKIAEYNYVYSHDRHESHNKRYGSSRYDLPTFI